jgi:hypothetical protein
MKIYIYRGGNFTIDLECGRYPFCIVISQQEAEAGMHNYLIQKKFEEYD